MFNGVFVYCRAYSVNLLSRIFSWQGSVLKIVDIRGGCFVKQFLLSCRVRGHLVRVSFLLYTNNIKSMSVFHAGSLVKGNWYGGLVVLGLRLLFMYF